MNYAELKKASMNTEVRISSWMKFLATIMVSMECNDVVFLEAHEVRQVRLF